MCIDFSRMYLLAAATLQYKQSMVRGLEPFVKWVGSDTAASDNLHHLILLSSFRT